MTRATDQTSHDLIERYLQGVLCDEELAGVERRLFEDPEFIQEVELHRSLKCGLKSVASAYWQSGDNNARSKPWPAALWNNAVLAWLLTGACAVGWLASVALHRPNPAAVVISDEIALHDYRGPTPEAIEAKLSTRATDAYVLVSVDTALSSSFTQLFVQASGTTESLLSVSGVTDDTGTLTVAVPAAKLPIGGVTLRVVNKDATQQQWNVMLR